VFERFFRAVEMVFRVQLRTALLPRKRKLQCRNGHYLEVRPDGTVRGTKNNDSIYSKYQKYIIYRSFAGLITVIEDFRIL